MLRLRKSLLYVCVLQFLRYILLPFSAIFQLGLWIKEILILLGLTSAQKVPVPVFSVGNISLGGAGKTPVSMFLLQFLRAKNENPAYLSRGYGRKTRGFRLVNTNSDTAAECGEEALMVAGNFPTQTIAVSENRVEGALQIIQEKKAKSIVLDDAFQHRKIFRDLDIVVVDVTQQNKQLIPAGKLREPISALKRADFVLLSKSISLTECESFARKYSLKKWAAFHLFVSGFSGQDGKIIQTENLKGKKALLFSGIGNPLNFEETLRSAGIETVNHLIFPDHHSYKKSDFERILNKFDGAQEIILTTEKDYYRLKSSGLIALLPEDKFFFTRVEMAWLKGKTEFENEILSVLKNYGYKVL